jgi:hypothetical protein
VRRDIRGTVCSSLFKPTTPERNVTNKQIYRSEIERRETLNSPKKAANVSSLLVSGRTEARVLASKFGEAVVDPKHRVSSVTDRRKAVWLHVALAGENLSEFADAIVRGPKAKRCSRSEMTSIRGFSSSRHERGARVMRYDNRHSEAFAWTPKPGLRGMFLVW